MKIAKESKGNRMREGERERENKTNSKAIDRTQQIDVVHDELVVQFPCGAV